MLDLRPGAWRLGTNVVALQVLSMIRNHGLRFGIISPDEIARIVGSENPASVSLAAETNSGMKF
jgi:hypothetical protein